MNQALQPVGDDVKSPPQLQHVRFEVEDSGIGTREEGREIIFSRFEQIGDQTQGADSSLHRFSQEAALWN